MGAIGVPAFFVLIFGLLALFRPHLLGLQLAAHRKTIKIVTVAAGVVMVVAVALDPEATSPPPVAAPAPVATSMTGAPATTTSQPTASSKTAVPTTTVAPPPTTTVPPPVAPTVVYPPTTLDQFKTFARTGNPTAIHPYKSEAVGAVAVCPQPRVEATADVNLPVRELQADEAAFFLHRGYLDQNCGGVLFLYDSPTASHDEGFNVGRVLYDVGSSDPAHRLEVDTSDITPAGSFTLNY